MPDPKFDSEQRPHLSVVIPAYNEETRLGESLPDIVTYLKQQAYTWEIVVVDDGSRDKTSEVARNCCPCSNIRVLRNEPNRGKGYSIKRGMLEATGEYRLFSDADLSTPIEELEKFWPRINEGCDVVIGSRALSESRLEVRQAFYREWMGRVFNLFVQGIVLPGIKDTQCGFKLFSAKAANIVYPHQSLEGFAFDVELLHIARKRGLKICEVPVRWINSPASKVSAIRDSAKMFLDLLRIRFRKYDFSDQ